MQSDPLRGIILSILMVALSGVLAAGASAAVSDFSDAELAARLEALQAGELPDKCLVPYLMEMQARGFEIQALERASAGELLFYDTPEGHFRIEYEVTGRDSVDVADLDESGVPDYVEWTGEAMEDSWAQEVTGVGFPAPDLGGERYRIVLRNLGGLYGATYFSGAAASEPGGSYIAINGNFAAFYESFPFLVNDDPDGLVRGAIRVTAAHEFKHTLQIAQGWNVGESAAWVELDAVAAEEVVYDYVNDYYNYLVQSGSPFSSPESSLLSASYEDANWQLYLIDRFGMQTWTQFALERAGNPFLPGQNAYLAMANTLELDWKDVWTGYASHVYLAGDRATPTYGFDEAALYPTPPVTTVAELPYGPVQTSLSPWANRFYEIDNSGGLASGGLRVIFNAGHLNWTVSVVLQNEQRTVVLPLTVPAGTDTLDVQNYDTADFDRVAVVVGNARVASAFLPQDSFGIAIETGLAVTADEKSFGSFKNLYRPTDQD